MGAWGANLYQNDVAVDVRNYYIEQLRQGKLGCEITQELIKQNENALTDVDDAPIFWLALADTQWNFGLLDDFVKNQALYYIHDGNNIRPWESDNPDKVKIRKQVLSDLEQKLLSPQPKHKEISKINLYFCEWKIGDLFAYRIESDYGTEKHLYGRYLLIHKIDEASIYPGHIVPIVYVKITDSDKLPTNISEYENLKYIQTNVTKYEDRFLPIDGKRPQEDIAEKQKIKYEVDDFGFLPQFRLKLLITSKRSIPKKLIYIGNFRNFTPPEKEFIPHSNLSILTVTLRSFEKEIIERYFGYNLQQRDLI